MIEREEPLIRQSQFIHVEPSSGLEFVDNGRSKQPQFIQTLDHLPTKERIPRVATSISKIETWLPYILYKEGQLDSYHSSEYSPDLEKAAIIGQEMHRADVLFNLIIQGNISSNVIRGLPTASQEDIDLYGLSTEEYFFREDTKPGWLANILKSFWQRFLQLRQQQEMEKIGSFTMFPSLGIPQPGDRSLTYQILQSEEFKDMGFKLAQYYVDRCFSHSEDDWDYLPDHQSLNETLAIFNLERLQIRCRFDRITRPEKSKKTLQVQVSDFKTGHPQTQGELQTEIKKRQAQLMYLTAQQFALRYILDKRWLSHRGSAFILKLPRLEKNVPDRVRFFYRWFDKETGGVTKEEIKVDRGQRDEFLDWFDWYSSKVQEYKEELKKVG